MKMMDDFENFFAIRNSECHVQCMLMYDFSYVFEAKLDLMIYVYWFCIRGPDLGHVDYLYKIYIYLFQFLVPWLADNLNL